MSIFKACDVRGRYGDDLTPEFAGQLGLAIGAELAGESVAVGGDLRLSTAPLKAALMAALQAAGCLVIDLGILPTPAFYFARRQLRARGGVMVTGSHNPPADNGFKISLGPLPATEAELTRLRQRIEQGSVRSVRSVGSVQSAGQEMLAAYQSWLTHQFAKGEGQRVVIDAGNGAYSRIAPDVLRDLGYDVVELFCEPDGRFPNRPPNPAIAANLRALREIVLRSTATIGAAFDGDGDRVVFVDERGRVVESDRSLVLFARALLRQNPGEVIYDLKCSSVVAEEVQRAGGVPVMERSGHAFIKTALLQRAAILGGEISGHFFFPEVQGDDGLYATLLMLRILAEAGQSLAALADSVPRYPITPDLRLPCTPPEAQIIVDAVARAFEGVSDCEISRLDGVRISWADGWGLVRPSVTEPLLTLRFEARTDQRLAEIRDLILKSTPALGEIAASAHAAGTPQSR